MLVDPRDPAHARPWVALVDGNAHQIERIHAEADRRGLRVSVSWTSCRSWSTCGKRPGASTARATPPPRRGSPVTPCASCPATRRKNADTTATYLINKKPYLDALAAGWPIATGIIEGTCRHLVKDRMDITGACWGLDGAEAVLRLRALTSNGDFDTYWTWHLTREHHRTHLTHYQDHTLAACPGHSRRAAPFRFR